MTKELSQERNSLTLKWGTLKAWDFKSEKGKALLQEYFDIGASAGAASQNDTERQKEIICELIDEAHGKVQNDWTGEMMTKKKAKEYVMNYGKD
jgi:hypothetical protein